MTAHSLDRFAAEMNAHWGPLDCALVDVTRARLSALLSAAADEPWLAALHRDAPERRELVRDADHGFLLLAHVERRGCYRAPHDHGRGWVAYGVQHGAFEMCTYAALAGPDGRTRLVRRDARIVRAGEVMVYLPGDIHDTRCLTDTALEYRFSDRDLRAEERAGRMTRYVEESGGWTAAA